ncbi:hypothetical protein [Rothia koreensis]|uniref:hypothetical protein n=1 Tax=Rothia koreensis TaxID=592378 RepID=UPI003FCD00E7
MAELVTSWDQLKHGEKVIVDGKRATFYGVPYLQREADGKPITCPGEVFAVADEYTADNGEWFYWSWATGFRISMPGEFPVFEWRAPRAGDIQKVTDA